MTTQSSDATPPPGRLHGGLRPHEHFWRDRQVWLEEHGYMLRPRYKPDWQPSWLGTSKSLLSCEDGLAIITGGVLDATRISDGAMVMLKKVDTDIHPYEVDLGHFLSSETMTSDPRNRCVRTLDVLPDPVEGNIKIIVLPLLRQFDDPDFATVGEAVACLQQVIEGLQFMHEQHVAHRDISILNVMMDGTPMYPDMWHPRVSIMKRDYSGRVKHYARTERPPKYYHIDFGLSRKYDPDNGPPRELPIFGGDKNVPEFQGDGYDKPADPFRTDIYYLGSFIREGFLEVSVSPCFSAQHAHVCALQPYCNMEFMRSFVADMVQNDPESRPTIEEVASRSEKLFSQLASWNLRARLVQRDENVLVRTVLGIKHIFRTARYLVKRLPAIPTPTY
ncbi:uncharacterized protein B0H18DRAFT_881238 [Fomitopsis serialis]|uniref:uncharacterized protein n=1 Tax=Fomitopsis serialis TaxID=139415 RepID=UPI002007B34B|nr:uncharacterized protein B0H18DRAFT_881238 [Neoantrodia serialis]KAH9920121.1 hypothetical protein B0H18DRAFT_881238 [Neoantrodia serialis]